MGGGHEAVPERGLQAALGEELAHAPGQGIGLGAGDVALVDGGVAGCPVLAVALE